MNLRRITLALGLSCILQAAHGLEGLLTLEMPAMSAAGRSRHKLEEDGFSF